MAEKERVEEKRPALKNWRLFAAEEGAAASFDQAKLNRHAQLAKRMFRTPVLTVREMGFPALADFAKAFIDGVNVYRSLFFVSILKLDMLYVASILSLISVWDVLNDPLVGIVYDKTRTRWGKARPYLFFTPLPYFLSTALLYCGGLFFQNNNTADPRKIFFVFIVLFIEETFKTIYQLPRDNLTILMTPNPKDRINMGLLTRYTNIFGANIVFAFILPVMDLNSHGVTHIPMSLLFAVLGVASASVASVANMGLAWGTRERVILPPKPADTKKSLFYLLKNKYAMRNYVAELATEWYADGGYAWDVVTQMEIMGGVVPTLFAYLPYNILNPLSVAFVPLILRIFGNNKRNGVLFFRIVDIIRSGLQTVAGILLIRHPFWFCLTFAVFWAMNAADNAPTSVLEGEMGREIADYTEYMTGERPDGTSGILPGLVKKIMAPLKAMFTIFVFRWSGYNPLIPSAPFSQNNFAVYQKVYFLFMFAGALPNLVKLVPLFLYDLVGEKREKMYTALNERRALLAKETAGQEPEEVRELEAALEIAGAEEAPRGAK
ncbi:MAG: MFS transporter [Oscillospiraceae bacterium]|nr:MFS transporter [Oscillospiraceae bacterium]